MDPNRKTPAAAIVRILLDMPWYLFIVGFLKSTVFSRVQLLKSASSAQHFPNQIFKMKALPLVYVISID
jgi:hypothetical protein